MIHVVLIVMGEIYLKKNNTDLLDEFFINDIDEDEVENVADIIIPR